MTRSISERKSSFITLSFAYLPSLFLIAGWDALVYASVSKFTLDDIFLIGHGTFKTSIFGYWLLLFTLIGFVCGAGRWVLDHFLSDRKLKFFNIFLYFVTIGSAISLLIGYRFFIMGLTSAYMEYVLFLSLGLLFVFILDYVSHKPTFEKSTKKPIQGLFAIKNIVLNRPGLHLAFLLIFLTLPSLHGIFLRFLSKPISGIHGTPNIVLLVMDAVRADCVSCYQHERNTTPNLDRLAEKGTLFLKAISPSAWTVPAHASIFTGLFPSQHNAGWKNSHLHDNFMTLAEYLQEKGYRTAGFSENPFVSASNGFAQGFQEFFEMYAYRLHTLWLPVIGKLSQRFFSYKHQWTREYAEDTVNLFKRWYFKQTARKKEEPFFAFLNFMPPHLPNYPRPEFSFFSPSKEELDIIEPVNLVPERHYLPQYKLKEKQLDSMRKLYLGDIAYLDNKMGELIDFLENQNLLENTFLIITSDHGENFGDHNLIEHQFCVYNSLLHVPLIIHYPNGIESARIENRPVSTLSIFQTIAELLNDKDALPSYNNPLSPLSQNGNETYLFAEYDHPDPLRMLRDATNIEADADFEGPKFDRHLKCVFAGPYKFIWSSSGRYELFNVDIDWNERDNIISENEEHAKELLNILIEWEKSLWRPEFQRVDSPLDKISEQVLKSLGYIK